MHAHLETYFKGGPIDLQTPEGKLAQSALEHYPAAVEARKRFGRVEDVELPISMRIDDVWYRGVVDLPWLDGDGIPNIADHKTSSNPEAYGLIEKADFLVDPQALKYAFWGLEYAQVDRVRLQWTYIATRGKKRTFASRVELRRDEVVENFMRLCHPTGASIAEAKRTIKQAKDLPINTAACGNYGGCPHAAYCPRSKLDVLSAVFGKEKSMGLMNKLRNKKKAPPRPEEVGNVVQMDQPGRRVNSPEAPSSTEVARAISREVGAVSSKPNDDASKQVADAAHGAETGEEVAERVQSAIENDTDYDPKASQSREQILKLLRIGITRFASSKALATKETPHAHGRTLNKMVEEDLITYEKDGKFVDVTLVAEVASGDLVKPTNGTSERPLLTKIREYKGDYHDHHKHAYAVLLAQTANAGNADALFVEYMRTFP